jgi:hypothetical protein
MLLALATVAAGQSATQGSQPSWADNFFSAFTGPPQKPHPAVVRIIVPNRDGFSLGSGALVAKTEKHGLVITNWHVVREASGPIVVAFPDGFRSGASVLRTDDNWDLAALAVWRPNVEPIPMANQAPRPGESLTIAGYGPGSYRTITGRCTQYVSPGDNQPFEMVELSAGARNGDSGGPILNQRGEMAGVLFGAAGGHTTGSYCGRVRWFLEPVVNDFRRVQPNSIQLAQQSPDPGSMNPGARQGPPYSAASGVGVAGNASGRYGPPTAAISAHPTPGIATGWVPTTPRGTPQGGAGAAGPLAGQTPPATTSSPTEGSPLDSLRNFLAIIGVAAILLHGIHALTSASRPASSESDK